MNVEALSRKLFSAVDTGVSALRAIARGGAGAEGGRFVELDGRRWASDLALSRQFLMRVQEAKWNRGDGGVNWRGIPNIKDPFALALYPLLLWELKPRTVIEIGSFQGGSALWFADLLDAMRVKPFHVHSFDIDPGQVKVADDPRITFRRCDSMVPSTIDAEVLAKAPHPWLVIEDAHVNVKAVLTHLNRSMQSGDYLVVEDTAYIQEKHEALREFARAHPGQFQVDTRFTDLFGYNGTFNFNGYLRKL